MSAPDLLPHWGDDDWTSFLLLIVPVAASPVPPGEVERAVRDRIERDPALFDLVSVARGPGPDGFEERGDWSRALLSSLLDSAMPGGRFLAPRVVLTIVLLGEDTSAVRRLGNELQEWQSLEQLNVRFYGCRLEVDPRHRSVGAVTVSAMLGITNKIMSAFEQHPEIAIQERTFLAAAMELARQGSVALAGGKLADPPTAPVPTAAFVQISPPDAGPVPSRPAAMPSQPAETSPRPAPTADQPAVASPRPSPTAAQPATVAGAQTRTPTAQARPSPRNQGADAPTRPARPPVFHRSEEIVVVDGRSPLQRLRGEQARTDAETLDRIAEITDAVSLAYLVMVPDEVSSRGKTSREYRRIALGLDRLLGTVVGDASSGRPMRVALEVFTAASPLRKHGVIHQAGELTESDLPRPAAEIYEHARTVEGLIGAAQRTAHAFAARSVQVMSLHFIFLSGMPLADAGTEGGDWDLLLRYARATWVELGPTRAHDGDLPFSELPVIAPSPFGFHLMPGDGDVPALVGRESTALYVYGPTQVEPPRVEADHRRLPDIPVLDAVRRWWPARDRTPQG
ncbi:hypothetical protein AB0B66_41695 [Catellatospora sp. NPDC049111]|uniref:hypothetical protein n=1 Tax=Catellatospora sp. NPDC049111 TaxID=3155271 RepID=UPI00340E2E66